MKTDRSVIQDFDTRYNEAYYAWNPFLPEADTDLRFYLGDQWTAQEKLKLFQEGRDADVFNRIRRNINLITGYQCKNQLSSVAVPIEDSDQETADQFTQLLLYVLQGGNGYSSINHGFAGACKTGFNLLNIWVDYRDDPVNGDIRFGREPYNGFLVDPYFTQLDFSDCGYVLKRKYLNAEQAASLLPGMSKDIFQLQRLGNSRDAKFTWLPYQRQPNGDNLIAYNEYYEQDWKNVPMLVDIETGEYLEFDVPKEKQNYILQLHDTLRIVERPKRFIKRHIILNDVLFKTEINPYGLDEYPFTPMIAIFEPECDQWDLKVQSLVRCQRDAQKNANQRRLQMKDMIESQMNSGYVAEEDSVVNPNSLFQTGQGRVIWRKRGTTPDSIIKMPPAQVPPSYFQLQELFDRDTMEILGINDANFGITENGQESGVMMMLRQSASLINVQEVMDNLRYAQRQISKKALKLIQNWTPQKVERIINQKPTQQFYNKDFTKYDVAIQEGLLTDTQKQMHFRQLIDIYQLTGGPNGSPITPQMLYAAAPIQGKSETNRQIEQNQQAQAKQAEQQAQVQQQLLTSQLEFNKASSIEKLSGAKERYTRAVANMGLEDSRASQAVQDRADATLARVKAIKELQEMDDDRLIKYLTLVKSMEAASAQDENEVKKDDVVISAKGNELGQPELQPQMQPMEGANETGI